MDRLYLEAEYMCGGHCHKTRAKLNEFSGTTVRAGKSGAMKTPLASVLKRTRLIGTKPQRGHRLGKNALCPDSTRRTAASNS